MLGAWLTTKFAAAMKPIACDKRISIESEDSTDRSEMNESATSQYEIKGGLKGISGNPQ